MRVLAWMVLTCVALSAQAADGWSADKMYAGGGLGYRELDDVSRSAVQLYVGMDVAKRGAVDLAVEAGYLDTSDVEADGVWLSALGSVPLTADVRALARLGGDFGDDAGAHLGFGVGYRIESYMETRLEFWLRDGSQSVMFNVAYYPWTSQRFR